MVNGNGYYAVSISFYHIKFNLKIFFEDQSCVLICCFQYGFSFYRPKSGLMGKSLMVDELEWIFQSPKDHTLQHLEFIWEDLPSM